MGLFKELVLLPLAPVRGTAWVAEQLAEEAERRLYDEDNIKREMLQLEIEADEGRLGEKERAVKEDELLDRLAIARRRQVEDQELAASEQGEMLPLDPTEEELDRNG
jgi:LPS O-antigen subunit length determinant protein (WzzB/FepE family)